MKKILNICLIFLLLCSPVWGGVDFDGADDLGQISDTTNWAGGDFSISFWLYYDSWKAFGRIFYVDDQFLIGVAGASEGDRRLAWNVEPDNVDGLTQVAYPSIDTLVHIIFIYDNTANTGQFYLNNSSVAMTNSDPASAGWTNSGGTDNILYFMNRTGGVSPTDGIMNEVYLWSGIKLTASERSSLYNSKTRRIGCQIQSDNLVIGIAFDSCADGASCDGQIINNVCGSNTNQGLLDNGANNTGLTGVAGNTLSYP